MLIRPLEYNLYIRRMTKDSKLAVLNLPRYPFNLKNENGKTYIWDILRKRFILLTPEEWVRQHFVQYLIQELGYPVGKTGNEIALKVNTMNKRCDTVIYDAFARPLVIVEYKAPGIPVDQRVFDQIFVYNTRLNVPFLFVSNGLQHFACRIKDGKPLFLRTIPHFKDLELLQAP